MRRIADDWDPPFEVVHCLEDPWAGVQCHPPPGGGVTVAVLDDPGFVEAGVLMARAAVESPESAPVEFGLAFSCLDDAEAVERLCTSGANAVTADFVFTGWRVVAHGEPLSLALEVLNPAGRLFLATRMADGGANRYAWSSFRELRFAPQPRRAAGTPAGEAQAEGQRPSSEDAAPTESMVIRLRAGATDVSPAPARVAASRASVTPLTTSALRSVRKVTMDWAPTFAAVHFLDEERVGVQCHPPPEGGVTVAAIDEPGVEAAGVMRATATVESGDSAPVEFALAFSSLADADVVARIRAGDVAADAADFAFTGWRKVSHGEPQSLALAIANPSGRLYFATRMADGASNWYAWSSLRDLRFAADPTGDRSGGLETPPGLEVAYPDAGPRR